MWSVSVVVKDVLVPDLVHELARDDVAVAVGHVEGEKLPVSHFSTLSSTSKFDPGGT
jgi:hypothetical protein